MLKSLAYLLLLPLVLSLNSTTLYAITNNKVYISLTNDDLISIDYSITGQITMKDDGITMLTPPSPNSSLFLVKDELYSMNGDDDQMVLKKYDDQADEWTEISLDFDDINDKLYYTHSSYLTGLDENQVYIYGGINDQTVTNRMLSLEFDSFKFSNITTTTKPAPFYGASNLLAPGVSDQLLVGGQSGEGWLNMNRLATWNFASGWSFQTITNSTDISSRKNSLLLPIFHQLGDNSVKELTKGYEVSKVLVLGGETEHEFANPTAVYLNVEGNDWYYEMPESQLNMTGCLGVASVFDNIITITDTNKRDGQYSLKYYDLNFNEVEKFQMPKSGDKNFKKSVQQKAILGTVIPVCSLLLLVGVGYIIAKKRKAQKLEQELNDLNYHFENDYKVGTHHDFDSNSTLDVDSIESWNKKRQQFKSTFMQSQDTLHNDDSIPSPPPPTRTFTKLNSHVVKLRNSMSFSNLPSPERKNLLDDEASIENDSPTKQYIHRRPNRPMVQKKRSLIGLGLDLSPTKNLQPNISEKPSEMYDDDEYQSDTSLDNFDVQVLVSSKRRTTLKVVNPDTSRQNSVTSLKYRIPSNEEID